MGWQLARWTACVWIGASWVDVASAQDPLAAAHERYAAADFEGTLAALDDIEQAGELSAAELARALELRALVHFGLRDATAADRTLRMLCAVGRTHEFSAAAPPDLIERFRTLCAEVQPTRANLDESGDSLVASAEGLDAVVRTVRLHHRRAGSETYSIATGSPATAPLRRPMEAYAEVIGPGGAVLATEGTAAAPRLFGDFTPAPATPTGMSSGLRWGLVAGATAVIVLTVVLAVVLSTRGTIAQPSTPVLEPP